MSDLFLDSQPDEDTFSRIAVVVAASGYTDEELDRIFVGEVAPVVYDNFYDVAGEWMAFPIDWLQENILRKRGVRYWITRLILMRPALWLV